MRLTALLLFVCVVVGLSEGRRVRVRPVASSAESAEEQGLENEYYAEQEEDQGPILVSRQDTFGRPSIQGGGQARYNSKPKPVAPRAPPVQTIRNYNKLNDDGSFTFGYEAADGSFKEETRGTDCVVRGKYGYIDPDGNKREFTYVSGNPCDPNAIQQEEEEEERPTLDSGEENIPKGLPTRRPNRPSPSKAGRPSTTVFQADYNRHDEEEEEENIPSQRPILQTTPRPQPTLRPTPTPIVRNYPIPSFAQLEQEVQPQILRNTPRPKVLTPSSQPRQQVSITPRPQPNLPATTYRPTHIPSPTPKLRPTPSSLHLDDELKSFQLENNVVSTPSPRPLKPSAADPVYTSELVFDPSSGQYNTVVYQQLPQSGGDFSLRGRLQPFVAPQVYRPYVPPQRQEQISFLPQQRPLPFQPQHHQSARLPFSGAGPQQQQLFQQQQASLVQQSSQLFAAQQQRRQQEAAGRKIPSSLLQQEPQTFSPSSPVRFSAAAPGGGPQPQFYYVSPDSGRTSLATGQIDAFLRGHNQAFQ